MIGRLGILARGAARLRTADRRWKRSARRRLRLRLRRRMTTAALAGGAFAAIPFAGVPFASFAARLVTAAA